MSFNLNTETSTSAPEATSNEERRSLKSNISKTTQEDDESKYHKSISIEADVHKEQSITTVQNLEDYIHHSKEIIVSDSILKSTEALSTTKNQSGSANVSKSALEQERLSFEDEELFDHSDYRDVPEIHTVKEPDSPSISTQTSSLSEEDRFEPAPDMPIDRAVYYEMYMRLKRQHEEQKRKNNFLQKKLAEYYIKKKMYHVLMKNARDDSQKNYEKLLDELDSLNDSSTVEKQNILYQEIALKNKWRLQQERLNVLQEKLQQIERDYAKQFAEGDSTKQNRIDRYLKHQKNELLLLSNLRLQYIKGQNLFIEKEQQLNALENLGPDLRLMNYQQLKYDNRNLQDRLEEKELELSTIRFKCKHLTQVLAHRREKLAEFDMSIKDLNEQYDEIVGEFEDVREQLSYLKQERDMQRSEIEKLKADSGLLTKPMLLMDMQNAMEEVEELAQKLKQIKKEYYFSSDQIDELRRMAAEVEFDTKSDVTPNESNAALKSVSSKDKKLE